jgi:hypothetical protein
MQYRVHRVEVGTKNVVEALQQFLNGLTGEVLSVFPHITPTFQGMGATAKVDYLVVVEKIG